MMNNKEYVADVLLVIVKQLLLVKLMTKEIFEFVSCALRRVRWHVPSTGQYRILVPNG